MARFGGTVRRLPAEPGLWILVGGDMVAFSFFFVAYAANYVEAPTDYAAGQDDLDIWVGIALTLLLLTSSLFVAQGVAATDADTGWRRAQIHIGIGLGAGFVVVKMIEWGLKFAGGTTVASTSFHTFYFLICGIHLLHVLAGIGALIFASGYLLRPLEARREANIEAVGVFWHLVDLLWVFLFALFYLVRV